MKNTKALNIKRILCLAFVVIMMLSLTTMAFATSSASAIEEGITGGTEKLYNIMTAVVLPVAAVFFAWNAFKALFGGDRGMEQAKKNMLTIVIVIALIYLAPLVITEIGGWFSGNSNWNF